MRPDPEFSTTPDGTPPALKVGADGARLRRARPRGWVAGAVAGSVVGADAITKAWASQRVPTDPAASDALVQVRHVTNAGATLGLGAQYPAVVLGLALVATGVVAWWLAKATGRVEWIAVAVVLGGAVGNLLDRVVNGAVTDWIHIAWYPATFNLADVAIRGGLVVAVVARALRRHHAEQGNPAAS